MADAARSVDEDPGEIVKITWQEAMNRFGVDKPDLRFGMELVELTEKTMKLIEQHLEELKKNP